MITVEKGWGRGGWRNCSNKSILGKLCFFVVLGDDLLTFTCTIGRGG